MSNPYLDRPEDTFWKTAVASKDWTELVPTSTHNDFVRRDTKIAAAGSCFAQKVASYIKSNDAIEFVELETVEAGQPLFSARYGNIYTTRQLLELINEAESGVVDESCAVTRADGRFVDVYRPFVVEDGFESAQDVIQERAEHLKKVHQMLIESDVFVFTLGLTEAWMSKETSRTFPVCPGIFSEDVESEFVNFGFKDVLYDLAACVEKLTTLNPDIKVITTVSPVPLTATYTDSHVMSATTYSKAVLRAVVEEVCAEYSNVHYFPSYEIVVNPYREGNAFEANMRSVKQEVVDLVMQSFEVGFLDESIHMQPKKEEMSSNVTSIGAVEQMPDEPVCDDVQIEKSVGF